MLTCPQCKAENKDGEVICYRCGSLLNSVRVPPEPGQEAILYRPIQHWETRAHYPKSAVTFKVKGFDEVLQVILNTELILGRSSSSGEVDVDLNAYGGNEKGVSRRHAKMIRKDDLIMITDLGSANNTYINGQKVAVEEERIVRDGDELRLGRLIMNVNFGEQN